MIDFEPTEEQKLMVTAVSQLAVKLRARAREHEKARALSEEDVKSAFEMGLGAAVSIDEDRGGAGLGLTTAVLLEEALAYGDASAPFALAGPGIFGSCVAELAGAEAASALIGEHASPSAFGAVAWSEAKPNKDRPGLSTVARRDGDGWVLRGEKAFVVNASRASRFVVFAQVDEAAGWKGIAAFVVPSDAKGLKVGDRKTTLGLDAVPVASVLLEDVRVEDAARLVPEGDFTQALLRFFVKEGLKVAARSVGLSEAAFDVALEYVTERKAFGKPIGHFQAVAFTLADRAMDLDAGRTMVLRAAVLWDGVAKKTATEKEALLHSAWAISYALEAAMKAGDDAVQLHGGAGFMRDYFAEKYMRDAKQLQLCVMTSEQADQLAAALELGLPLDPALVLPNAETQSVFI